MKLSQSNQRFKATLQQEFDDIPYYHYSEASRISKELREFRNNHPNSIIIGTISDNHIDLTDRNATLSGKYAGFALQYVKCDVTSNFGDNCVGTNIDNDLDYANEMYMKNQLPVDLTFNLVGNHEKSNSTQKIFDIIGKNNVFDDYGRTQIRGYGLKDYTEKKCRIICLNTCDYWNSQGGNGMSYEQKEFLMESLDISHIDGYEDWTIIILSHIPLDFLGGDYNKSNDIKSILVAYMNGSEVNIDCIPEYARAENELQHYEGVTLTHNYNGVNQPKIINLHGHIHTNKYGKLKFIDDGTELNIIRVATPNSSFYGNASTDRYSQYGDYSISKAEAEKIKKVTGTKADTSATFYGIDFGEGIIYSFGYGADIDRVIAYKDIPVPEVNLFDPNDKDFVDSARFSSDGSTTGGSGYCSGYIECNIGDTIIVRCPEGSYAEGVGLNNRCICIYDENKTNISVKYPYEVVVDEDGKGFRYTVTEQNGKYFRVAGNPNGKYQNFVVKI